MYRTKRRQAASHQVFDLRELHLAEDQAGLSPRLPGRRATRRAARRLPADRRRRSTGS